MRTVIWSNHISTIGCHYGTLLPITTHATPFHLASLKKQVSGLSLVLLIRADKQNRQKEPEIKPS